VFGRAGVVVCFSLGHVGISMVFWERRILIQIFTWTLCCHSAFWVWWCSGMLFARTCRHFNGILGKTYTYSDFYLESENKVVPVLEFEDVEVL